jgi:glycosyltransferase involved in cell wall biosynthesis
MRVLMLVSSPFITDPRVYNEALSLVKAGYEVTVLAWDRENQNPYRQMVDGIDAVRLRIGLSPKYGLGVPPWHIFHIFAWQWQAYRAALILNKESAIGAIHCHFLDTLPVGIRLKRKFGVPLIYDARDMYGYMMRATFPLCIARVFEWLEKRIVAGADRIIAVNEVMAVCFADMTDKPVTAIMNCKPIQGVAYQGRANTDKFTLLYIGILHKARSLAYLIGAMKVLPDVYCVIGGVGQSDYVEYIRKECSNIPNVTFAGRVPADMVLPMTLKADVVVSLFDPENPNGKLATPNKLFEAMACGRPIICPSGTYCAEITEREGIGLAVDYTEAALGEAIIRLRDDRELREKLGRNALLAAINKYNWPNEEKKLLELYAGLQDYPKKC